MITLKAKYLLNQKQWILEKNQKNFKNYLVMILKKLLMLQNN